MVLLGALDFLYECSVLLVDQLRQYFTQLRQELGQRLVEKVFGSEDKPSKVCSRNLQQTKGDQRVCKCKVKTGSCSVF